MNHRIIIVILLGLCTSMSFAQTKVLTLEESIATGLENSKTLHSSEMKLDYAEAKSEEASASLYPTLKLQASYQRLSSIPVFDIPLPGYNVEFPVILNNYNSRATFQQPLFTGWKLQGEVNSAEYTAEASKHDLQTDKDNLVYDITSAYWNLYKAIEVKRLSDENVNQMSSHLDDIQSMFTQGMATTNDVLKVKVQLSNAKLMQSDAANNVRIAMISFNSIIGLPLSTDIGIGSSLTPTTKEFPSIENLMTKALTGRPDIQGMEWRLRAAESQVTSAKAGWSPQIYLTGDYYYARPNSRIFPEVDQFKDTWDVGISLQFDLWNNLTTIYQTSAAEAQYSQTKDALGTLKDNISVQVTESYLSFNEAKEKIQLSRLTVDQAEENLRVTREKFKAGLTTNSELIDAEVARLQAKLELTQSLVDYELAEAKVEQSIGEIPQ
jgi:outer membrane protein